MLLDFLPIIVLIAFIIVFTVYILRQYKKFDVNNDEKKSNRVLLIIIVVSFVISAFFLHIYQNVDQNTLLVKKLETDQTNAEFTYFDVEIILEKYYKNNDRLNSDNYLKMQQELNGSLQFFPFALAIVDENDNIIVTNVTQDALNDESYKWYEYVRPIKVGNRIFKLRESPRLFNYHVSLSEITRNYQYIFSGALGYRSAISFFTVIVRNFLLFFTTIYVFLFFLLITYKGQLRFKSLNAELIENQKLKEAAYLELENFRHTYEKIKNDFSDVVNDSKNSMQQIQSTWDEMEKQSAKLERHDIINALRTLKDYRITDETITPDFKLDVKQIEAYHDVVAELNAEYGIDFIENTYIAFIEPCINKIHTELKGLENILDLSLQYYDISEILNHLSSDKLIPNRLENNNEFSRNIAEFSAIHGGCNIIMTKLESIVFNLIANSAKANQDYFEEHCFDENFDYENYKGLITVNIYPKSKDGTNYLCIEVSDSGGGFGENIVNDIYRKPVKTTKDNIREYGEATVYIGFFVRMMKGFIEASNYQVSKDIVGAKTVIYIPVYND